MKNLPGNLFIGYQEGSHDDSVHKQETFSELSEPGTTISNDQLKYYNDYIKVCDDANEKIKEIIADFVNNHYDSMKLPE